MSYNRKNRFRSDVNKAYRLICDRGQIDDGELQYLLDVSQGPFYRIRKALLAIFPDVEHVGGFFRLRNIEEKTQQANPGIDHWGDLEPEKNKT